MYAQIMFDHQTITLTLTLIRLISIQTGTLKKGPGFLYSTNSLSYKMRMKCFNL